jgi:excisionase family DNA binding protein
MNELILSQITLEDLANILTAKVIAGVSNLLPQQAQLKEDQLIKLNEVAELLHVSKVTIFAWKKAGKIPFYRISNKVYFKKQEVIDALNKVQRRSI